MNPASIASLFSNKRTNRIAFLVLLGLVVITFIIGVAHVNEVSVSSFAGKLIARKQLEAAKPRYVFVDLGANSGDSCLMFLQDPSIGDKYNFPTPPGMRHEDAEIYLFEANPSFNADLVKLKQNLLQKGIKVHIFPSTPVWVDQQIMPFYIDRNNDHAAGSSIDPSHPDPVRTGGLSLNLTTISIAHFLLQNFLPQDFVVVKMDIELAEYTIVPHMADMNVDVVMDYLFVEWHSWLIDQKDPRVARSQEAVDKLKKAGVQIPTDYNTYSR